jgi:hypothetical protein
LPDASGLVNALYNSFLDRPPTNTESQTAVAALNTGATTQQLVANFMNSPEFAANVIRADYVRLLGRPPEAGAIASWTPLLTNGGTPETLAASILASDEFFKAQGGTTSAWLNGVYNQTLNRPADNGGLTTWGNALKSGMSRTAVVTMIMNSPEGMSNLVVQDYNQFLGRNPDATGLSASVSAMQNGMSNFQLISMLVGSSEFSSRPQTSAGPNNGPLGPKPPGFVGVNVGVTGITPDTGYSSTDGITSNNNPLVLGSGDPNTAFTLTVDGINNVNASTDSKGNFKIAMSKPLSLGAHTLGTIINGKSLASDNFKVYIDQTAPTGTLTAPDFTETTTPTVTVTGADNYQLQPTFFIDVDLKHDGSFTDPGDAGYATGTFASGTGSVVLPALPEGTYNLQARIYDAAGNLVTAGATMQVDPNAGFIGDHWLLDLYHWTMIDHNLADGIKLNTGIFLFDSQGRVLVQARSTLTKYMGSLQSGLQSLGMTVLATQPDQNMIIGWLPISQIMNMGKLAHFSTATAALKPEKWTGSVDTEGDSVIGADTFRASTGIDGTGVTVGVLSDSVNEFAGGLADSVASGDLPNNVKVLEDELDGLGADEGRAMLEIVHDIAPGASLAFHSAFNGPVDFAQGILDLMKIAGAKVIADDVGYADEPMFNDGLIAKSVDQVHNAGVTYASAAGNDANIAWTDKFRPVTATVGGTTGTFENFSTIPGARDVLQRFSLPAFGALVISFQWDAAFLEGGSPLANYQVPNDMQVLVTDGTTVNVLATFNTNNKNTDEAFEFVVFFNPNPFTTGFAMAFQQNNPTTDPRPTTLRWVNFGGDDPHAQGEGSASSFGHPVAQGAIAVGAVPWFSPDTPEPFTAQGGPVQINFDLNGFRLATPQIRSDKPQVAAPDGVSTSFFGEPNPATGQAFAFFGTSAATPHVAGAAALFLQQVPSATPDDILLHLEDNAIDVGPTPGFDNLTGFGRIIVTTIFPTQAGPEGDRFELNEDSTVASQMGMLNVGRTLAEALTIKDHTNGLPDYDWYSYTAPDTGTVAAKIHLEDSTGSLEIHLFTVDSTGTLIELANDMTPGAKFLTVSANVTAGEPLLIEIKGLETSQGVWGTGVYSLTTTMT